MCVFMQHLIICGNEIFSLSRSRFCRRCHAPYIRLFSVESITFKMVYFISYKYPYTAKTRTLPLGEYSSRETLVITFYTFRRVIGVYLLRCDHLRKVRNPSRTLRRHRGAVKFCFFALIVVARYYTDIHPRAYRNRSKLFSAQKLWVDHQYAHS